MRILPLIISLLMAAGLSAQQAEPYAKARVWLTGRRIADLAALGVEADHGTCRPGAYLENVFSREEIRRIRRAGFRVDILIPDMAVYYAHRPPVTTSARGISCDNLHQWETPAQYTYGSMGGYQTLDELYAVLDTMHARYPNLITARMPIDTFLTEEGRPLYYVILSDHPDQDEGEPEILYTALHHAREPNSMSQLLFFMWYLLEHYDSDPNIKSLVDRVRMVFVPCVNPDGYVYNQTTNPNGGGFWRKNRWKQDSVVYGVDLNRNYGYKWGYNNVGSSNIPGSQTYRGTAPFSEPETRAMRFLCQQHDFQIALNYHTFGNLLIHPWGYSDTLTPDHASFEALGRALTRENGFVLGTGTQTVGYTVNGDSDDWMYGDQQIFSMTPEVGPEFWPSEDQIDGLNKTTIYQNLTAARLLLNYAEVRPDKAFLDQAADSIRLLITHPGLAAGPVAVKLTAGPGLTLSPDSVSAMMTQLDSLTLSVAYALDNTVTAGDSVALYLSVTDGLGMHTDTVRLPVWVDAPVAFEEMGALYPQWLGDWQPTTETYVSAPQSITDSPDGPYPYSAERSLVSDEIDLTSATGAALTFWAKWDIEPSYDYVQLSAVIDNTTIIPLCGRFTKSGSQYQDKGQPVYDGKQADWVREYVSLDEITGQKIRLQFVLKSDFLDTRDGFYFDDLKVLYTKPDAIHTPPQGGVNFFSIRPNPAKDQVQLQLLSAPGQASQVIVTDVVGRERLRLPVGVGKREVRWSVAGWPAGLYLVRLQSGDRVQTELLVH